MRKLFLTYFFSILAITVLSLLLQNGILLLKYSQSQTRWKDFVYVDFVDNIEKSLNESSFPDYSIDSMRIFSNAMKEDSRVSGFVVKDQNGKASFVVEQTAEGQTIASPAPKTNSTNSRGMSTLPSGTHTNTVLNIVYNNGSFEIVRSVFEIENSMYFIPAGVNGDNVIGTVTIQFESQTLSSIDILSFSPRTYKYSKDIISSCTRSIMITVPICFVLALVFSYIISATNAKYINSIRKALNELSNGNSNIKLKKRKNSELNEITTAVSELDQTLQANKKSRQAWLTSISHDLNTPATAMKMIVDGLNDGIFKANKATLIDLQNENNLLCDRINRVIEYSSLQADTKANIEKVSCTDLINSLPAEYSTAEKTFLTDNVICDKLLMSKVIIELLKNAYAASNGNNVKLCIMKESSNYILTVSNPGTLPQGLAFNKVFEPWTKGDSSRGTSGNGLGLAIVSAIAQIHNGETALSEKDGIITVSVKWSL